MRRSPVGLVGRLVAAEALVLGTGALTLALVAALIGPGVFHMHLEAAPGDLPATTARHVEEAFFDASGIALGIAIAVAMLTAFAVAVLVARRLARPVVALAAAARRLSADDYAVRARPTGLGPEFDALTTAFNAMAERLESTERTRRRLLADLAHELRTPLATIDAYLEGIADGVLPADETSLSVLTRQSARMRRLVEDVAAVSKAEEHQLDLALATVDAGEVVRAVVTASRPGYQAKGVGLELHGPAGPLPVRVDVDRLSQVLTNVIDNALRHTPAGGRVDVAVRATGAAAVIEVADTGEGVAAEHLPHLFERFYRADTARDRAHGGSGIGLAVARAIVAEHGGTISARSPGPGRGTTFTVRLPRAA